MLHTSGSNFCIVYGVIANLMVHANMALIFIYTVLAL